MVLACSIPRMVGLAARVPPCAPCLGHNHISGSELEDPYLRQMKEGKFLAAGVQRGSKKKHSSRTSGLWQSHCHGTTFWELEEAVQVFGDDANKEAMGPDDLEQAITF
ncbi:hypothetical protein MAPG_03527 [Magnaporthiopsis poae ATCC 64411]|uniref:Uncharacterized protein n=1 Tax=Magnaporthiopsis poae (strain ATCC 64411 / 73-15) TaxID=644358 RepID=A0A0C4DU90_MAGP6|nr:hypothetical protein MAPG_03527 [Magnaporthiopsis poae ATCC 64411]